MHDVGCAASCSAGWTANRAANTISPFCARSRDLCCVCFFVFHQAIVLIECVYVGLCPCAWACALVPTSQHLFRSKMIGYACLRFCVCFCVCVWRLRISCESVSDARTRERKHLLLVEDLDIFFYFLWSRARGREGERERELSLSFSFR